MLTWESAQHDDEPGDQDASTALVPHGYWSLGPDDRDGRWYVELIVQDEFGDEIEAEGISLGGFPTEAEAKQAAQAHESGAES